MSKATKELLTQMPIYVTILEAMIKGKSFRLSKAGKESWKSVFEDIGHSDRWWTILCINYDGTLNICGNNHTILEKAQLTDLQF